MKATTALAAAIGVAFALAAISHSFAADPRGSTPSKPNRVTAVPPPPPPPGGPDKFTTRTRPPGPDGGQHARPSPVDDFAPDPKTQPARCHTSLGILYGNCVASLALHCKHGISTDKNGTSAGCSPPPQN